MAADDESRPTHKERKKTKPPRSGDANSQPGRSDETGAAGSPGAAPDAERDGTDRPEPKVSVAAQRTTPKPAANRERATTQPAVSEAPAASAPTTTVANRMITAADTTVRSTVAPSPTTLPRPRDVLTGLLEFARRNLVNKTPIVTDVQINRQSANGVITGDIDGKDPDELGKKVQIRSTVWAGAPSPGACGCQEVPGLIALAYSNPATIGGQPGDNWHAPDAIDRTTVYLNPDYTVAYYAGNETGTVTIDGLGTGHVQLDFVGNLNETGTREKSVATLVPELGTGDLRGVEGTVTSESGLNADGTANGVLTGEVVRPELRYIVVRQPEHGTVTVDELTGAFVYTADPAFTATGGGADSFQVLVTDNRWNLAQILKPYNGDPVQTVNLTVV